MKFMIAVPCMDTMPVLAAQSLINMHKPKETAVVFHPNSLVYDARNLLSLQAIQERYDYVLWVDSDILCPADGLMTLIDDMETYDTRMVSGLYVMRSFPPDPVIYDVVDQPRIDKDGHMVKQIRTYTNYPEDSVFDVDGCGFGFVLTRVDLLKDVWDKFGPAFAPLPWASEDISFCHRVNILGDQIMCDSRVKLGHIGTMVYTDKLIRRGGGVDEKH